MIPGGVVDTHLHLWDLGKFGYPWLNDEGSADLRSNYLVEDWVADATGVDVVATVHVQAELDHAVDPVEETAWLASLGGVPTACVGYADLRAPDLDDVLDRHQEHALFRGIRQQAWYDPHSAKADVPRHNLLDDPHWSAGLDRLASRGLTFDLQVWPHQLAQAASIFRERPDLSVVLEHTGLPVDPDPSQRARWSAGLHQFAAQIPQAVLKISALRLVSPTWSMSEFAPVVH
jgi:predicted TIM-barrel fold metal-dependent hydrolase